MYLFLYLRFLALESSNLAFFQFFKLNLAWVCSRDADLVHRNEKLELEARKKFYKSLRNKEEESTKRKLKILMLVTKLV